MTEGYLTGRTSGTPAQSGSLLFSSGTSSTVRCTDEGHRGSPTRTGRSDTLVSVGSGGLVSLRAGETEVIVR